MKKGKLLGITRRKAVLGMTAGLSAPLFVPRSVLGGDSIPAANDTLNVGAIGIGF